MNSRLCVRRCRAKPTIITADVTVCALEVLLWWTDGVELQASQADVVRGASRVSGARQVSWLPGCPPHVGAWSCRAPGRPLSCWNLAAL